MFRSKVIRLGTVLTLSILAVGCGGFEATRGDTSSEPNLDAALPQAMDSLPLLATPVADSPAAGICVEVEDELVIVTINLDIPDPRCSIIRPEQMLKVINHRDETLTVKLGHLETHLAPGDAYLFDLPFGQYLAAGVHRIEVQPCCGAELVLGENQPGE